MKKIEEDYKKQLENITPSEDLEKRIYNNTIYKKNNYHKLNRVLLTISTILLLGIVSIGVVFADEIKDKIKRIFLTEIDLKDPKRDYPILQIKNLKEINYDADLEEYIFYSDNVKEVSREELESKLNVKFLNSEKIMSDKLSIFNIDKKDNKIAEAEFFIENAFKLDNSKDNSSINFSFKFITKYSHKAENGYKMDFYPTRDNYNEAIQIEYLDNLNTDVYFEATKKDLKDDEVADSMIAVFVYDDVTYRLFGNRVSKNMMLDILKSLK